jgi:hypothetical protein
VGGEATHKPVKPIGHGAKFTGAFVELHGGNGNFWLNFVALLDTKE